MRLDLFSKGDSVLLLGEGNLSFSVCLHKHKIPVEIVATCFESKPEFEHQPENIDYLKSNKVPVFLNVDATKLRENAYFSNKSFSKIVFNFPHVGGKMKIHQNRALLRNVFENCSQILAEDGLMIVSLCRGQGGTPADQPRRKWHDSWQVTEMAAHGDFVLVAVEPFLPHNFTEYRCIGYRGQDVQFHLAGALVHVFAKRKSPFASLTPALPATRLALSPLKPNSNLLVPIIYSELYQTNPITNPHSPISFLNQLLLEDVSEWNFLKDDDVPFHLYTGRGVACRVDRAECRLRATPSDIFPHFLKLVAEENATSRNTLFLGTYFSPLGRDFSSAPVRVDFTLAGEKLLTLVKRLVRRLVELFEEEDVVLDHRPVRNGYEGGRPYLVMWCEKLVVERKRNCKGVEAGVLWGLEYEGKSSEVCVLNAGGICEYFFDIGWREMWGDKARVVVEKGVKPRLIQSSLYPNEYKLDVTLRYTEAYSEERVCELLWLAAGQLIEEVKMISEYTSAEGWSSKCYRVTYRSLDKPLFKKRVVEVHSKIVGRVLQLGLNVAIGWAPRMMNAFAIGKALDATGIRLRRFFSEKELRAVALKPKKAKTKEASSQYFIDACFVETVGGKGGDGCISVMRIKSNEKAGPDGGDGGNGGHVIFKASSHVTDLNSVQRTVKAPDGERGFNKDCCGKSGSHTFVKVPVGTIVRNHRGVIIGDLGKEGSMFIAARGGAGGRGNHFFVSDILQTPQVAEFGAQGEKFKYILEVKSMAHIGLVGMPNAGKSTLLRAISRARPEVAAYAFTTLRPHIGVVQYSDHEQVSVADLPGLVEGSHKNKGLGIEFLKHAERCKGILFIIDLSQSDPKWQYETLRYEISKFSEELNSRPFAVVGNKLDLVEAQANLKHLQSEITVPVIGISAKTGKNLAELLKKIRAIYDFKGAVKNVIDSGGLN